MIFIDYILIAVVVISTVISLFRGFFKEALSLATWVIAIWVAWRFGQLFVPGLEGWIEDVVIRRWISRAVVFIGVMLAGGLVTRLAVIVMASSGLSGSDRAIGMVFGFARGIVLTGLLLAVLQLMGFAESPWWQESKLIPYAAPVADIIRHAAEDGLEYLDEVGLPDMG